MMEFDFINKFMKKITFLGSPIFYFFLLCYTYLISHELFPDLLFSLMIIVFVGYPLRLLFFRQRPKKEKYNNLLEKIDASSFPSGHAARITSLFILLSRNEGLFLTIFLLLITLLVLNSRIILKKHYYSDILGGIILGVISSI